MNRKAQLGGVIYLLALIVITGIILTVFQGTINQFRVEAINDMEKHPSQNNTLLKLLLYALNPLIWIFYIFLSVIVLFLGIRQGQ